NARASVPQRPQRVFFSAGPVARCGLWDHQRFPAPLRWGESQGSGMYREVVEADASGKHGMFFHGEKLRYCSSRAAFLAISLTFLPTRLGEDPENRTTIARSKVPQRTTMLSTS